MILLTVGSVKNLIFLSNISVLVLCREKKVPIMDNIRLDRAVDNVEFSYKT